MGHRLFVCLLLAAAPCFGEPRISGTPEELTAFLDRAPDRVSFTGHAEETAYTDRAVVNVLVTTEARELAEALQQNQALRDELRRRYVDAGIDAEQIKSARFSTSPEYGWFGREPASYVVANRLSVKVEDETQLIVIAGSADEVDGVEFAGVQFEHSEEQATEQRVRAAAVTDALARARAYADPLGLTLEPVAVHDSESGIAPSYGARLAGRVEEIVVTGERRREPSAQFAAAPASFDEVTYSADVTVTFEVTRPAQQ